MYDVVVAGLNECQVKTTELECDVYDVEIAVTSGTLNALIRPLRRLFQHPCPFTKNLWACEGFGGSLGYLGRVGNKYWNPYHGSQKKLTCCKNNSSRGVELIWGCFPHIMSGPEPTSPVAWFISGLLFAGKFPPGIPRRTPWAFQRKTPQGNLLFSRG